MPARLALAALIAAALAACASPPPPVAYPDAPTKRPLDAKTQLETGRRY